MDDILIRLFPIFAVLIFALVSAPSFVPFFRLAERQPKQPKPDAYLSAERTACKRAPPRRVRRFLGRGGPGDPVGRIPDRHAQLELAHVGALLSAGRRLTLRLGLSALSREATLLPCPVPLQEDKS